jgi:hypothetical protein
MFNDVRDKEYLRLPEFSCILLKRCNKVKNISKVVPVLNNKALRREGVWESACIDPHFLHLGIRWR